MTADTGAPLAEKTVLRDVRVFDGDQLQTPTSVVVEAGVIGTDPHGGRPVDCDGGVLLPGLIDCHVHLHGPESLRRLRAHGVTTALDMACWPPELVTSLRGQRGLTDIRSAGTAAIGPGVTPPPDADIPADCVVATPEQADTFVATRIAEGCDYIKIMAEAAGTGGPDQPSMNALVAAAHRHGRAVVVHALSLGAYTMALDAGADFITHIPLTHILEPAVVARIAADRRVVIPTLTIMEALAPVLGSATDFDAAQRSVAALHQAGVPVLAGTDSNAFPSVPVQVPHGQSIHHELELLVDCGLNRVQALRAATSLPAHHFGLVDRGAVAPGYRADMVLIDGDPLADISATRNITRIWCAGTEYIPATPLG